MNEIRDRIERIEKDINKHIIYRDSPKYNKIYIEIYR